MVVLVWFVCLMNISRTDRCRETTPVCFNTRDTLIVIRKMVMMAVNQKWEKSLKKIKINDREAKCFRDGVTLFGKFPPPLLVSKIQKFPKRKTFTICRGDTAQKKKQLSTHGKSPTNSYGKTHNLFFLFKKRNHLGKKARKDF